LVFFINSSGNESRTCLLMTDNEVTIRIQILGDKEWYRILGWSAKKKRKEISIISKCCSIWVKNKNKKKTKGCSVIILKY
jgi:hypothetical protein